MEDNEITRLRQRKESLKEAIGFTIDKKKQVLGIKKALNYELKVGKISLGDYNQKLAMALGGRTFEEWLKYYNDYLDYYKYQIKLCNRLIIKEYFEKNRKKILVILILMILIVLIGISLSLLFIFKPFYFKGAIEELAPVEEQIYEENFTSFVGRKGFSIGKLSSFKPDTPIDFEKSPIKIIRPAIEERYILESSGANLIPLSISNRAEDQITQEPNLTSDTSLNQEGSLNKEESFGALSSLKNYLFFIPSKKELSNYSFEQAPAFIGKKVGWKKELNSSQLRDSKLKLPIEATDIKIKKVLDGKEEDVTDFFEIDKRGLIDRRIEISSNKNFFTGNAILDSDENSDYILEYNTPPPKILEENVSEFRKKVRIESPKDISYENVLSFTELPIEVVSQKNSQIKIYRVANGTKEEIQFEAYDTNENKLLDYVEWIGNSSSVYEIVIEISKAEHLDEKREFISDIYSAVYALDNNWSEEILEGQYVRVTFERMLDNTRDITIYPRIISGNPRIEVYEIDGDEKIAEFSSLMENKYNKIYLTNLIGKQDVFDLRVVGGSIEIDHIIDPYIEIWKTPTAIMNYTSQSSSYPASNSNDTQLTTLWQEDPFGDVDDSTYEWNITYDMGGVYDISKIRIYSDPDSFLSPCKVGSIKVCDDSACLGETNLNSSCIFPGTALDWKECSFNQTLGRYIEVRGGIQGLSSCADKDANYMNLFYEFQAYVNQDNLAPDINFTAPTPNNGEMVYYDFLINATANDSKKGDNNVSLFINFDKSLVLWWRMDDVNSSGDIVDYFGIYNGTKLGNAKQTNAGYMGKAFDFDGNGDYVQANFPAELDYSKPISVSFWAKNNKSLSIGESRAIIEIQKGSTDNGQIVLCAFIYPSSILCSRKVTYALGLTPLTAVDISNWTHYVAIDSGGDSPLKLFVNGIDLTQNGGSISYVSSNTITIGRGGSSPSLDLNGSVDDVMIFNRTLSTVEIQALYANQTAKYLLADFSNSKLGIHNFTAYVQDISGRVNKTEERWVNFTGTDITQCTNLSRSNTIYTFSANIINNTLVDNCFNITAQNITLDCQGYYLQSDDTYTGVFVNATDVTIRNCNITMGYGSGGVGIFLYTANNSKIFNNILNSQILGIASNSTFNSQIINNTVKSNKNGISFVYGSNNTFFNNTVSYNLYKGLSLYASSYSNITGNLISYNPNSSLILESSNNTLVYQNNFSFSSGGIFSDGMEISLSKNNLVIKNNFEMNQRLGIGMWNSTNNTLFNNSFKGNGDRAVYMIVGLNNTIINNTLTSTQNQSIMIVYSNNTLIFGNSITNNTLRGLYIAFSPNTSVLSNNISFNGDDGLTVLSSNLAVIEKNILNSNLNVSIAIYYSNNTNVSNNILLNGRGVNSYGIASVSSNNNFVLNNSIFNNFSYGIDFEGGASYSYYHMIANNSVNYNQVGIILINGAIYNDVVNNSFYHNEVGMVSYGGYFNYIYKNNFFNCTDSSYGCLVFQYSDNNLIEEGILNNSLGSLIRIMDGSESNIFNDTKLYNASAAIVNVTGSNHNVFDSLQIYAPTANVAGIYSNSTNTTIKNCNISVGDTDGYDISMVGANYSYVYNNTLWSNNNGLYSYISNDIRIENNTVNCTGWGIVLYSCNNSFLINNIARSNGTQGIVMYTSYNNILINNTILNTAPSGSDVAFAFSGSDNNTLINNTVSSKSGSAIYFSDSHNNTLTNNKGLSNSSYGFLMTFSLNNSFLSNQFISNTSLGTYLYTSYYNFFWNNSWTSNSSFAFYIDNSLNNLFIDNAALSNEGNGLYLRNSFNNSFVNITAISKNDCAVGLNASSNNTLKGLRAEGLKCGINITNSSNLWIVDSINISGNFDVFVGPVIKSVNNTFLNCTYDSEVVNAGNELIRKWYFQAYVNDSKGLNIANANITAFNKTDNYNFNLTTNASGWTNITAIIDYINDSGTTRYYSNYTLYADNITFSDNHKLNVTQKSRASGFGGLILDVFTLGLDKLAPDINFTAPTPDNGATVNYNFLINVSANDTNKGDNNISVFIDFDKSLRWWRMDDVNSSGDVVEYFGRYNGTKMDNAAQTNAGFMGKGFEFDGDGDYVDVVGQIVPDNTKEITFCAWFNTPDVTTAIYRFLFQPSISSGSGYFDLSIFQNRVSCGFGGGMQGFTTTIEANKWYHVCCSRNSSYGVFKYTNGIIESGTGSMGTLVSSVSGLHIGSNAVASGGWFNGTIDDVIIFTRTLSDTEIAMLYANQTAKYLLADFSNSISGKHNFTAYAQDTFGNVNKTEQREVNFTGTRLSQCTSLILANTVYTLDANIINNTLVDNCINITAQNVTLDCKGYYIKSDDNYAGVYSNQYNTTIKKCNITMGSSSGSGINFKGVSFGKIENTTTNSNYVGIYLGSSFNNTLLNINSSSNFFGIELEDSHNNSFFNIIVNFNLDGIYSATSLRNIFVNVTANSNGYDGIIVGNAGAPVYASFFNIIANSNGNHGMEMVSPVNNTFFNIIANSNNKDGISISSSSSLNNTFINITVNSNLQNGIFFSSSSNNTLFNITANSNNLSGISFVNSNRNRFSNISLWNCSSALFYSCLNLSGSSYNTIVGGIINKSNNNLISLKNSHGNLFKDLKLYNSLNDSVGVYGSSNNTFDNLTIYSPNTDKSGIYSNSLNTTIKNCNISMGSGSGGYGIYGENSKTMQIFNNTLYDQQYGIYLSFFSDAYIYNNTIYNQSSGGAGILISAKSPNISIDSNRIYSNSYNIVSLANQTRIINNFLSNGVSYGIYIAVNSFNNLIANNLFFNDSGPSIGLVSTGGPISNTTIINNTFNGSRGTSGTGGAIQLVNSNANNISNNQMLNCSSDPTGLTCIHLSNSNYNFFSDNLINRTGSTSAGIRFYQIASSHNVFRNMNFSNIGGVAVSLEVSGSINNTFVNCSYRAERVDSGTELIRSWYYQAYVNDSTGLNVANANITAFNRTGNYNFNITANVSGWTNITAIIDYINNSGTTGYYSNYTTYADNKTLFASHALNVTKKTEETGFGGLILDVFTLGLGLDTIVPDINFTAPTPANGSTQTNIDIFVNVTASDVNKGNNNISTFIDFDRSLVGWWRMDEVNTSGAVIDNSSYGNNAYVLGNAVQTSFGYLGKAFNFDGNGDYLNVSNSSSLNLMGNFTLSVWIKPPSQAETFAKYETPRIIDKGNDSMGYSFGISNATQWQDNRFIYVSYSGYVIWSSPNSIKFNEWQHALVVYDGRNITFYINGKKDDYSHNYFNNASGNYCNPNLGGPIDPLPAPGPCSDYAGPPKDSSMHNLRIGGRFDNSRYFNGSIDDVLIFNRALNESEIVALYANQSSRYLGVNFTNLAFGNYNFIAYAQDTAGNVNKTEQRRVLVAETTITNCQQLQNMKFGLNLNYVLGNNINCTFDTQNPGGALYNSGAGFDPIGDNLNPFTGTFDGKNFNITGLHVNRSSESYVGLFGYIGKNSEIKNFSLYNLNITGGSSTGGLVGYNNQGKISALRVYGIVSGGGGNTYLGGLAGFSNGTIDNSHARVDINAEMDVDDVGGFVGRSYYGGLIRNCSATGNVFGGNFNIGGFVGKNYAQILRCYSIANVTSAGYSLGGFVGQARAGNINDCYSRGNVTSTVVTHLGRSYEAGGFVGDTDNDGALINSVINRCYATGDVLGGISNYTGGFAGLITDTLDLLNSSFSTGSVTGSYYTGGFAGYNNQSTNNSYWNNKTTNPDYCWENSSGHYNTGCFAIESNERYFKGDVYPLNNPMAGWNFFEVWSEVLDDFPHLTWEGVGGDIDSSSPQVIYVDNIGYVDPKSGDVQNVTFNFTVYDVNGYTDLNSASARANFSKTGYANVRENLSCILAGQWANFYANYSCTIRMWYFDEGGTWNTTVAIADMEGNWGLNTSQKFNYNFLGDWRMDFDYVNWSNVKLGALNQRADYNITITNLGNMNISDVTVNATYLLGQVNPTYTIPANSFAVGDATKINYCAGNSLVEGVNISSKLNISYIYSTQTAPYYGELGFCIKSAVGISAQLYKSNHDWGIEAVFLLAAISIKRKKKKLKSLTADNLIEVFDKKLKEKYNIGIDDLLTDAKKSHAVLGKGLKIPLSIFREKIGMAEVLCKYLKENKSFRFIEIANIINRDERTVWINYNNAIKKKKDKIKEEDGIYVPIKIFTDRSLSILEAVVNYLRKIGFKNSQISKILDKDPRNIGTLYSRVKKKLNLS